MRALILALRQTLAIVAQVDERDIREIDRRELKLSAGEVVPIDVEINPTSRIWHAGETIRMHIAGRYIRDPHWIEPLVWETDNAGEHVIHTGGQYESFLQIPVIPPKYDDDTVFVVDESAHPTHPIF